MNMKCFIWAAAVALTVTASCTKEDASTEPKLTATLNLPPACPANDSVEIRLFEAGQSTILAEKTGLNGKPVDFGEVNPGNYFFVGYSVQDGSPCDHWGGMGLTYYSDNFQVTQGQGQNVVFP